MADINVFSLDKELFFETLYEDEAKLSETIIKLYKKFCSEVPEAIEMTHQDEGYLFVYDYSKYSIEVSFNSNIISTYENKKIKDYWLLNPEFKEIPKGLWDFLDKVIKDFKSSAII